MEPSLNPAKPLRFYELGFDAFQRLCRGMFEELEGVKNANVYGKNGQSQRGIDIEVSVGPTERWVAQCKACEGELKQIRTNFNDAIQDFTPHLPFWKERGLSKYILLFGCVVEDAQTLNLSRDHETKFRDQHGITFELWDSDKIAYTLRGMRRLVEQHAPSWVVEKICGNPNSISQIQINPAALNTLFLSEIESVQDDKLNAIKSDIEQGRVAQAEDAIRNLIKSVSWPFISMKVRARSWRMLMVLVLNRRGDPEEAEALLQTAKQECGSERFAFVETAIRLHRSGAEEALSEMPTLENRDEWHLRSWLLISTGRPKEALALLQATQFEIDAETYRLRALGHIAEKNLDKAKENLDEARRLGPGRIAIEELAAIAGYLSSVSPSFENWGFLQWPVPPPRHMIKTDSVSLFSLAYAERTFAHLCSQLETASSDWTRLKAWQIACQSNIPERFSEAEKTAIEVLQIAPNCIPVLVWAHHRGFKVDVEVSISALKTQCGEGLATIDPVQALTSLLSDAGEFEDALSLALKHRPLYEKLNLTDVWRFQVCQLRLALGDEPASSQTIEEIQDPNMRGAARVSVATMSARKRGWNLDLANVLHGEYERTKEPDDLFHACEAHLILHEWGYVAKNGEDLLQMLPTETVLRLVVESHFRMFNWQKCLDLLNKNDHLFSTKELPADLRRVKMESLEKLGKVTEAQKEAKTLHELTGSSQDKWNLTELLLRTGKIPEALTTARGLLDDPNLTTRGSLHLADRFRSEDPALAATFFENAINRVNADPVESAIAAQIGFKLGRDDIANSLLHSLSKNIGSDQSPLMPVKVEDLFQLIDEQAQARSDLETQYRQGRVHLHLYAEQLGTPLVAYLWGEFSANERSDDAPDLLWTPLLRHASRKEIVNLQSKKFRGVFLDITSVLVAAQLDILTILEQHLAPISVSASICEWLNGEIGAIGVQQPSRIPPKQEVVNLVADGTINTIRPEELHHMEQHDLLVPMGSSWCALLEFAKGLNGWLVNFLPLTSHTKPFEPVTIQPEHSSVLCGCHDIISILASSGLLPLDICLQSQSRIPTQATGNVKKESLPHAQVVVLDLGIAEQLSELGVLSTLSRSARVFVRREEVQQLQIELRNYTERVSLAGKLKSLRERISIGIEKGTYQLHVNPESQDLLKLGSVTAVRKCLVDFIDIGRSEMVLSCCDDRAMTRYRKLGKSRIVGVLDLMWHLFGNKVLDRSQFFMRLYRLRRANARYIPISKEEIIYHIQRTEVKDSVLVETPELAAIRRYASACLLDYDFMQQLQATMAGSFETSEKLSCFALFNASMEALVELWRDSKEVTELLRARSSWIIQSLWFDLSCLSQFASASENQIKSLVGKSVDWVLLRAFFVLSDAREMRQAFLGWLFEHLGSDEEKLNALALRTKATMFEIVSEGRKLDKSGIAHFAAGWCRSLPADIVRRMRLTKSELKLLEIRFYAPARIGEHVFDSSLFVAECSKAFLGKRARIWSEGNPSTEFRITIEKSAVPRVILTGDSKEQFRVSPPFWPLMLPTVQERAKSLGGLAGKLDLSTRTRDSVVIGLARVKRPEARTEAFAKLCEDSLTMLLDAVDATLKSGHFNAVEASPKSYHAALQHLRLSVTGDAALNLEEAGGELMEELGFEESFARFSCLPVRLPDAIKRAFFDLGAEEKSAFISKSLSDLEPPLSKLHVAGLLLMGDDKDQREGMVAIEALCSQSSRPQWALFNGLLDWVYSWLASFRADAMAAVLAATWIHAGRLERLLSRGAELPGFLTFLRGHHKRDATGAFGPLVSSKRDTATPTGLSVTRLLVFGALSYVDEKPLSAEYTERLGRVLTKLAFPHEQENLPAVRLWEQQTALSNVLGSFLFEIPFRAASSIFGELRARELTNEKLEADVIEHCKKLTQDPANMTHWVMLAAHISSNPTTPNQLSYLSDALQSISFSDFADPEFDQVKMISMFIFSQVRHLSPERTEIEKFWLPKLMNLGEVLVRLDDPISQESSYLLCEVAYLLSLSVRGSEAESAEMFAHLASIIAKEWSSMAGLLAYTSVQMLLRQPDSVQAVMWKSICKLRLLAKHLHIKVDNKSCDASDNDG